MEAYCVLECKCVVWNIAYHIGLHVHLPYCIGFTNRLLRGNHTSVTTLIMKFLSNVAYFVKYSTHRSMDQIKVVTLNEVCPFH